MTPRSVCDTEPRRRAECSTTRAVDDGGALEPPPPQPPAREAACGGQAGEAVAETTRPPRRMLPARSSAAACRPGAAPSTRAVSADAARRGSGARLSGASGTGAGARGDAASPVSECARHSPTVDGATRSHDSDAATGDGLPRQDESSSAVSDGPLLGPLVSTLERTSTGWSSSRPVGTRFSDEECIARARGRVASSAYLSSRENTQAVSRREACLDVQP